MTDTTSKHNSKPAYVTVRYGKTWHQDAASRELDTGSVERETKKHWWLRQTPAQLAETISAAESDYETYITYKDGDGNFFGLGQAAKWVARQAREALETAGWDLDECNRQWSEQEERRLREDSERRTQARAKAEQEAAKQNLKDQHLVPEIAKLRKEFSEAQTEAERLRTEAETMLATLTDRHETSTCGLSFSASREMLGDANSHFERLALDTDAVRGLGESDGLFLRVTHDHLLRLNETANERLPKAENAHAELTAWVERTATDKAKRMEAFLADNKKANQ